MTLITQDMLLKSRVTRKLVYTILAANAGMVNAVREDNIPFYNAAKLKFDEARRGLIDEMCSVLGRRRNPSNQRINCCMAAWSFISYVFSTSTTIWGAAIFALVVILGITVGIYLQYSCLMVWEKSDYALVARITAGIGDGLEALFLVILDHLRVDRVIVSAIGLSLAAAMRITGKTFNNSLRWSYGGILLEAIGEVALCALRWRAQLTEGRWKISHKWHPWVPKSGLTPGEQAQLMAILWDIRFSAEFEQQVPLTHIRPSAPLRPVAPRRPLVAPRLNRQH